MDKVREVMTRGLPQVDAISSVLDASNLMNEGKVTGVVVFEDGKPVGMLTERSLLRRFVKLDKPPHEVRVGDVMTPLTRVDAAASVEDAAKKMLEHGLTRLGVFEGEKLVGWVTLTDIAREMSKQGIVDSLLSQDLALSRDEMICPACRAGLMNRVVGGGGKFVFWECPNCGYQQ